MYLKFRQNCWMNCHNNRQHCLLASYLFLIQAVDMQISPMCNVVQQIRVIERITIYVDTLCFHNNHNIWQQIKHEPCLYNFNYFIWFQYLLIKEDSTNNIQFNFLCGGRKARVVHLCTPQLTEVPKNCLLRMPKHRSSLGNSDHGGKYGSTWE